jgi:predicted RNA-binding Zn-ribbon protein involved in translation (DUF1610 family)
MKNYWRENAKTVDQVCGGFVNWEEEFYVCPECGEPIYNDDWSNGYMSMFICPVCELTEEEL